MNRTNARRPDSRVRSGGYVDRGGTSANVEKAREEAKRAELTPIVPSPKDVTKPAYHEVAHVAL